MAEEFIEGLTDASAGANATSLACCAVISPQLASPQSRMAGSRIGIARAGPSAALSERAGTPAGQGLHQGSRYGARPTVRRAAAKLGADPTGQAEAQQRPCHDVEVWTDESGKGDAAIKSHALGLLNPGMKRSQTPELTVPYVVAGLCAKPTKYS
jgi:hypothetical protein